MNATVVVFRFISSLHHHVVFLSIGSFAIPSEVLLADETIEVHSRPNTTTLSIQLQACGRSWSLSTFVCDVFSTWDCSFTMCLRRCLLVSLKLAQSKSANSLIHDSLSKPFSIHRLELCSAVGALIFVVLLRYQLWESTTLTPGKVVIKGIQQFCVRQHRSRSNKFRVCLLCSSTNGRGS